MSYTLLARLAGELRGLNVDIFSQPDFFGLPWGGVGFIVGFIIVSALIRPKNGGASDSESERDTDS